MTKQKPVNLALSREVPKAAIQAILQSEELYSFVECYWYEYGRCADLMSCTEYAFELRSKYPTMFYDRGWKKLVRKFIKKESLKAQYTIDRKELKC